jgi:hypothetical protein
MWVAAFSVWIGLTIVNFLYQAGEKQNWRRATEVSLYQLYALVVFVFVMVGV